MSDDSPPERRQGYGEIIARLDGLGREIGELRKSVARVETAFFIGNGQPSALSRLATLEARGAPTRAERGGVIGAALGAAIIAVLAYLGIKPGGQQ